MFSGHEDLRHAQNWPVKKKLIISAILIWDSLAATFASSIFSPAGIYVGQEFHIGREVVTLATSLFVLGEALQRPARLIVHSLTNLSRIRRGTCSLRPNV